MTAADAQEVKTQLLQTDEHYRQLAEQHQQLDNELHQLSESPYLSPSAQLEELTLKKRKLALKDRMEQIAREYLVAHHDRAS